MVTSYILHKCIHVHIVHVSTIKCLPHIAIDILISTWSAAAWRRQVCGQWSAWHVTRDTAWRRCCTWPLAVTQLVQWCGRLAWHSVTRHTVTPSHWHWSALSGSSLTICCVDWPGTRGISASLYSVWIWMARHGILELNFTELAKVCLRGGYRGCGGGAVLIVVAAVRRSLAQWNIFIASIRSVLRRVEPDLSILRNLGENVCDNVLIVTDTRPRITGDGGRGQRDKLENQLLLRKPLVCLWDWSQHRPSVHISDDIEYWILFNKHNLIHCPWLLSDRGKYLGIDIHSAHSGQTEIRIICNCIPQPWPRVGMMRHWGRWGDGSRFSPGFCCSLVTRLVLEKVPSEGS